MMCQGNGDGGGCSCGLERGLNEGRPDDRGWRGWRLGRYILHEVSAVGHVPIVLHNLLDDLIFLVVEYAGAEVMLYLVLQD